ncbi:MAG: peptide transporter ATP-binding protein [Acidimicrobiaceae bacterium]|nr:peptide transporter ATP-binding protein [Acidimicrobiaceae bacterium]
MTVSIVQLLDARKVFRGRRGAPDHVAVDDVSFEMSSGETLGIVGESGSGKTTIARLVLSLARPTSGHVYVGGIDVGAASGAERKRLPRIVQAVFQDPFASLDPRMTIGASICQGAKRAFGAQAAQAALGDLLDHVGLPQRYRDLYPHELSGGQLQRVAIARALAMKPDVLVADEPVSALDVSMQGQVLNLLIDLRHEFSISCLFISHDLGIVQQFCERVLVMESGKVVEEGVPGDIFRSPSHPYTQSLIEAIPKVPA